MAVGVVEVNAAVVSGPARHDAPVAFQVFLYIFVGPRFQAQSIWFVSLRGSMLVRSGTRNMGGICSFPHQGKEC